MVATFHLLYLGHRIKYENLKVGNTTQQLLSTTRPYCSTEFIEWFLFLVILVTYNIGIYIFVYIFIKLAIFILFFVSSTVMFFSALHAKHFEIWKNILWNWWVDCFSYLLLIAESINWDTSGKPTVVFFSKITSPSWIILSISLDELNSVNWLLKSWWWIFLKFRILIWQKILEVFWRLYLNIILWMLTSLVIWNLILHCEYYPEILLQVSLNQKLKLIGGVMKHFLKKLLDHEIFRSMVS